MTDYSPNTELFLRQMMGTWVVSGGNVTPNGGDPTKFDIDAIVAYVTDTHTNPNNPVTVRVERAASTAETLTLLGSAPFTFLGVDIDGVLIQQATNFTNEQARDIGKIGGILHVSGNVDAFNPVGFASNNALVNTLSDLSLAIGTINLQGNVYQESPAAPGTLKLGKNAGLVFVTGGAYKANRKNPNNIPIPLTDSGVGSPTVFDNFSYTYLDPGDPSGFALDPQVSDIEPILWDDGSGTPATVAASDPWTTQKIFLTGAGTFIHYGRAVYKTKEDALAALQIEIFDVNPGLSDEAGGIFRAWLVIERLATDLSDLSEAEFIAAGKFGSGASASSTSSTTSLPQAYANSTDPEFPLDDKVGGGISIIEPSTTAAIGDLFEIQNNARTETYLGVTNLGITAMKMFLEDGVLPDSSITPNTWTSAAGPLIFSSFSGTTHSAGFAGSTHKFDKTILINALMKFMETGIEAVGTDKSIFFTSTGTGSIVINRRIESPEFQTDEGSQTNFASMENDILNISSIPTAVGVVQTTGVFHTNASGVTTFHVGLQAGEEAAHTFHLKSGAENSRTELAIERRTSGSSSLLFKNNTGGIKNLATSGGLAGGAFLFIDGAATPLATLGVTGFSSGNGFVASKKWVDTKNFNLRDEQSIQPTFTAVALYLHLETDNTTVLAATTLNVTLVDITTLPVDGTANIYKFKAVAGHPGVNLNPGVGGQTIDGAAILVMVAGQVVELMVDPNTNTWIITGN